MTVWRHLRVMALAAGAILLAGLPASADIKSFNAAMQKGDYKAAAAAAASSWSTLDKSRDDLAIIAREFGFAAYMAEDFAAARGYGEAAVAASTALGEAAALRAGSEVLLRAAELQLTPTLEGRSKLIEALRLRAAAPGLDAISYAAADFVATVDFEGGAWRDAAESATLAERLAANGGKGYQTQAFRFALRKNVASYMDTKTPAVHPEVRGLRRRIIDEINAAPGDAAARPLVALYWETTAWEGSIRGQLFADGQLPLYDLLLMDIRETADAEGRVAAERAVRLLDLQAGDKACRTQVKMKRDVKYPGSARYKGITGVVLLKVDVNEKGVPSNPELLAVVPDRMFGKAVTDRLESIRFEPYEKWDAGCTLARKGKVVTFQFRIAGGF